MNKAFPRAMQKLIREFSRMPGIGPRSAQRFVFYILGASAENVESLARAIHEVKETVKFCGICNHLSEGEVCSICRDPSRDPSRICVVEGPGALFAVEKGGVYNGLYHVLLGALSPIEGVGPDDIKIKGLLQRVEKGGVKEVIIATDFTTEGETTALYLREVLEPFGVKVSRLSRGVPAGGVLEYADVATLQRAFEDRKGV